MAGKANSKKTDVLCAVREKWKVNVNNDDEADAFGLARYLKAAFEKDRRFPVKIDKFLSFSSNQAAMNKIVFLHGVLNHNFFMAEIGIDN